MTDLPNFEGLPPQERDAILGRLLRDHPKDMPAEVQAYIVRLHHYNRAQIVAARTAYARKKDALATVDATLSLLPKS